MLYSQEGENVIESMIIKVEKCSSKLNEPGFCKSETEINEFIKDIKIQLYILEETLDLRKREGETVQKS